MGSEAPPHGGHGEFIEDRAIKPGDVDSFGHKAVVEELAHLALNGPAPSNIALFAPWGTGKSGIAKLLEPKIENAGQRFVYFDAFKHRDTSLRRSFLRATASKLSPAKRDDVDRSVYGREVTEVLRRPDRRRLLRLALWGVVGALALTALVSWGLALIKPGPFDADFPGFYARTGSVLALVGGLIGIAISSLMNGYSVTTTSTPMAEDDEFEEEFEDIVKGSSRVIVFIDELDRCSADDVVATLETMRIFLEVENCVFVVAVDQQSLEQALRHRARQETPVDGVHPYFSSAGSYIDKIFQYQLALPPLRSRDMTDFVEEQVKGRPGVWMVLRDKGEHQAAIGALSPTHVTSPRRAKVLLNSFVIAHRLATLKVDEKEMRSLDGRRAALARLVSLRTEFPLFAAELDTYPRLIDAVLARSRGEDEHPLHDKAPRTWSRAGKFLDGSLPVAPLLLRPRDRGQEDGDATSQEEIDQVAEQQRKNMVAYLERVETLPAISPDLIFLHSAAGAGTRLEPEIADQLETAARDGAPEEVAEVLDELDESTALDVVRVLVSILASTGAGSLDATNATHVLLVCAGRLDAVTTTVADEAAEEAIRQAGRNFFEERDRLPALTLAARCSSNPAEGLVRLLGNPDDLAGDEDLRGPLLGDVDGLPKLADRFAAAAVVAAIAAEDGDSLRLFAGTGEQRRERIMKESVPRLKKEMAATKSRLEGEQDPDPEANARGQWVSFLGSALASVAPASTGAAEGLAVAVFDIRDRALSDALISHLGPIEPIENQRLRGQLLDRARSRPIDVRATFLAPVGEQELSNAHADLVDRAVAKTLSEVIDEGVPNDETVASVIEQCQRLGAGNPGEHHDATDKAIAEMIVNVSADEGAAERLRLILTFAGGLRDKSLTDKEVLASGALEGAALIIQGLPPAEPDVHPSALGAIRDALALAPDASRTALGELHGAAADGPADTLAALRLEVVVETAAELARRKVKKVASVPVSEVITQVDADPGGSLAMAAAWASQLATDGADLWAVLERYWREELPSVFRRASQAGLTRLGDRAHREAAGLAFRYVVTHGPPPPANWEGVNLRTLSGTWAVEELAKIVAEREMDESAWRRVLEICRQLSTGNASAQRRIGEMLLLPLAQVEDYGFGLAAENLGLVGKGNTGHEFVESFSKLADTEERRKLLRSQLGGEEGRFASIWKGLMSSLRPSSPSHSSERTPEDDSDSESPGSGNSA
jgi:hypothetical protein